jgi:hypothetical protein
MVMVAKPNSYLTGHILTSGRSSFTDNESKSRQSQSRNYNSPSSQDVNVKDNSPFSTPKKASTPAKGLKALSQRTPVNKFSPIFSSPVFGDMEVGRLTEGILALHTEAYELNDGLNFGDDAESHEGNG